MEQNGRRCGHAILLLVESSTLRTCVKDTINAKILRKLAGSIKLCKQKFSLHYRWQKCSSACVQTSAQRIVSKILYNSAKILYNTINKEGKTKRDLTKTNQAVLTRQNWIMILTKLNHVFGFLSNFENSRILKIVKVVNADASQSDEVDTASFSPTSLGLLC